jgi:hypothetical protein
MCRRAEWRKPSFQIIDMNNEKRKRRTSNTYRSIVAAVSDTRVETRSLPTLTRSYPCRFTFYVADPISSVQLYARRRETLVAFTSAKTLSPGMRCISWIERVVMIDAISPMLVSTITSLMTLSDTMLFTVPGSWFRMLSSIRGEDSADGTRCQWSAVAPEAAVGASG